MTPKATLKIAAFEIVNHGREHAQYFQGHGLFGRTEWTHCVTGCGETDVEALDDAKEQIAQMFDDVDTEGIVFQYDDPRDEPLSAHANCSDSFEEGDHDSCEMHWYISINFRLAIELPLDQKAADDVAFGSLPVRHAAQRMADLIPERDPMRTPPCGSCGQTMPEIGPCYHGATPIQYGRRAHDRKG